ncbi:hemerythrin domain-containing protein [Cupriavidus sp. 30B13]|uniref:hemerythrin domain-containing protein n=1 Tax=Cupriavidus sp. 30B13 TaxID=3384241 RepID=UPI003B914575
MEVQGNLHGAATAPRFDIYARIHKALRAFMADTLLRVGRADTDDDTELRATLDQLRELLSACEHHLHTEDRFVHPAMEAGMPGSARRVEHEHAEHVTHIAALGAMADILQALPHAARAAYARDLYRKLSLFVAENFVHMNVEETEHNAVLWAACDDAGLAGVENRIVASLPPETIGMMARWMLPNVTPAERALMLSGMRDHAPEAFAGMLEMCRAVLPVPEWMKLARALGLPAGPGLASVAA